MSSKTNGLIRVLLSGLQQLANSRFFSRDVVNPNVWQTIGWWEVRRVPYNLLVGIAGVITGAVCFITALACEHFLGEPIGAPNAFTFFVVLAYGITANVCYTAGWIAELIVQKLWPEEGKAFGKISFFLGLIFSILLTLAPGGLVAVVGGVRLFMHFIK